jgi:hypothetical protein
MLKNTFYQAKKNFFKYLALPALAIMASCSLSKDFVEDDIYYSPKDKISKTEIAYLDTLKNQNIEADTLEIKTLQDLNYAVRNGADATFYWKNYFMYSPYSSSLGWDFDGDGIVNAFDIHPWSYDLFDDINNNRISDALEFNYPLTTLDFIYWDLYYNYPSWNYPWKYNYNYNYNFHYEKDWMKPFPQRRQRTLSTMVSTQTQNRQNTGVKRSDELNEVRKRTEERTSNREQYLHPRNQERTNTNYNPKTNHQTRNTYISKTNTRSNTQTRTTTRQNTTTSSSGTTVRSSSENSNSSGSSRSFSSSNSKRSGRR